MLLGLQCTYENVREALLVASPIHENKQRYSNLALNLQQKLC